LENIEKNKRRIARWKLILPIGSRDPKYGKWSPTWEDLIVSAEVCQAMHIS
jgi:hypothetical protein